MPPPPAFPCASESQFTPVRKQPRQDFQASGRVSVVVSQSQSLPSGPLRRCDHWVHASRSREHAGGPETALLTSRRTAHLSPFATPFHSPLAAPLTSRRSVPLASRCSPLSSPFAAPLTSHRSPLRSACLSPLRSAHLSPLRSPLAAPFRLPLAVRRSARRSPLRSPLAVRRSVPLASRRSPLRWRIELPGRNKKGPSVFVTLCKHNPGIFAVRGPAPLFTLNTVPSLGGHE